MTQAQLQNIIKSGEDISVEFKKCPTELNHSVFETVCSFLNRTGGHLILGVADDGNITGVNVNCIEPMIKNFVNTVNNPELLNPTFYFSPEVFTVGDDKIIYIYIPESSQVHRYKGKIYDRVGDADNDITNNHYLINNIYLRKNRDFTENEVFPFLEVADLDDDTFKKARRLAGVWRDHHPWLSMDNAEILHSCGLWRKDNQTGRKGYTLAAALLFGKENTVLSCCPAYKTDAVYRNMTYERFLYPHSSDPDVRYDDRCDIRVNLIEAYQCLMAFINRNLPDKFHLEGIQRIDIRDKIFREIAANLLIHREYSHSFPAKFLIFSDRVITENWTKPAGQSNVTLDSLETHPKNPMIARVFKELGWVEELGSGRKNIKKYIPYYYDNYRINIENEEKFIFSITYRESEGVNFENEGINPENEGINPENEGINPENEGVNEEHGGINEEHGGINEERGGINEEHGGINEEHGGINEGINEEHEGINEGINEEHEGINEEHEGINEGINEEDEGINEGINEEHEGINEGINEEHEGINEGINEEHEGINEGINEEHEGINEGINEEHEGINEGINEEHEGINEGINEERGGINEGINEEHGGINEGINEEHDGINEGYDGINEERGGINEEHGGINEESGGINEERGGINLLLALIEQNPNQKIPFFVSKLNVSKRTVERWVKELRNDDKIIYKGSKKAGGYWKTAEIQKVRE